MLPTTISVWKEGNEKRKTNKMKNERNRCMKYNGKHIVFYFKGFVYLVLYFNHSNANWMFD